MKNASKSETKIDRFSLKDLENRYGISYTTLSNRLNRVGIKPIRDGRRVFLSAEQIEILDQLDNHIKAGGTFESFGRCSQSGLRPSQVKSPEASAITAESVGERSQRAIPELVSAIAALKVPVTIQIGGCDPELEHYRFLEEAAEKGWALNSTLVAKLLGESVEEIQGQGAEFRRSGFAFRQGENQWRVEKLE